MAGPLLGGFLGTVQEQAAHETMRDQAQTAEMLHEIAKAGNDPDAILGIQARLKGPPTKGASDLLAGAMKWAQNVKGARGLDPTSLLYGQQAATPGRTDVFSVPSAPTNTGSVGTPDEIAADASIQIPKPEEDAGVGKVGMAVPGQSAARVRLSPSESMIRASKVEAENPLFKGLAGHLATTADTEAKIAATMMQPRFTSHVIHGPRGAMIAKMDRFGTTTIEDPGIGRVYNNPQEAAAGMAAGDPNAMIAYDYLMRTQRALQPPHNVPPGTTVTQPDLTTGQPVPVYTAPQVAGKLSDKDELIARRLGLTAVTYDQLAPAQAEQIGKLSLIEQISGPAFQGIMAEITRGGYDPKRATTLINSAVQALNTLMGPQAPAGPPPSTPQAPTAAPAPTAPGPGISLSTRQPGEFQEGVSVPVPRAVAQAAQAAPPQAGMVSLEALPPQVQALPGTPLGDKAAFAFGPRLERVDARMNREQLAAIGGIVVDPTTQKSLVAIKGYSRSLEQMASLLESGFFPDATSASESQTLIGGVKDKTSSAIAQGHAALKGSGDPRVQLIKSNKAEVIQLLRIFGESSRVSLVELANQKGTLVDLGDTNVTAAQKILSLSRAINQEVRGFGLQAPQSYQYAESAATGVLRAHGWTINDKGVPVPAGKLSEEESRRLLELLGKAK